MEEKVGGCEVNRVKVPADVEVGSNVDAGIDVNTDLNRRQIGQRLLFLSPHQFNYRLDFIDSTAQFFEQSTLQINFLSTCSHTQFFALFFQSFSVLIVQIPLLNLLNKKQ